MTVSVSSPWFHTVDNRVREQLDEAVTIRRCAEYRKGFRWAAVSCPAEVLHLDAVAAWVRRHGVSVNVGDIGELRTALNAGTDPLRIVMHHGDPSAGALCQAVHAGVGRMVVNCATQAVVLTDSVSRRQRVLLDMTDRPIDDLAEEILALDGLDLIGVHRHLAPGEHGTAAVIAMMCAMKRIALRHGVIPTRLSLADIDVADWGCDPGDLAAISAAVEEAIETGCIAVRFGRPAVSLSPSVAALVPGCQGRC